MANWTAERFRARAATKRLLSRVSGTSSLREDDLPEWIHRQLLDAFGMDHETWSMAQLERVNDRLNAARRRTWRQKRKLTPVVLWLRHMQAFVMPGPYVYFSRRLLERCGSDDAVAFVFAHELAHHDLGHLDAFEGWGRMLRVTRSRLTAVLLRRIEHAVVSVEHELAADERAMELCLAAGYDAARCLRVLDVLTMEALDWGDVDAAYGADDAALAEDALEGALLKARAWWKRRVRSHPSLAERKQHLRGWLSARGEKLA